MIAVGMVIIMEVKMKGGTGYLWCLWYLCRYYNMHVMEY